MSLESVAMDQKVIDPTHTLDLKMDFEKSPLHNDRDGIGEIQNTRTIDMSKEKKNIIDNEEHLVTHDLIPIPSVRQDHFRLLDLPIELRNYIYSFLLPYNVIISHKRRRFLSTYGNKDNPLYRCSKEVQWFLHATTKKHGENVRFAIGRQRKTWKHAQVQTQMFLVNKAISCDAQAVLYGSNTYIFTIDGRSHDPISLASPLIFGPFGDNDGLHLPLLRNMRSIHIEVMLDTCSHHTVQRHRARLAYFADTLTLHPGAAGRKSLLDTLHVDVCIPRSAGYSRHNASDYSTYPAPPADAEMYMFGLESLATLRGVKDVRISGLPEWYAQCLTLCIQGTGGDVLETDWPLVQVERGARPANLWGQKDTKRKRYMVTTRKWYQPMLNWKEFAERNGIEVPADIDKFWAVEG